jgi:hypothetical protein
MRALSRTWLTDALFLIQAAATVVFGGSQAARLLSSQQGVNVTWFLYWLIFLLLNVALTLRAHRAQPSRVTLQALASYLLWAGSAAVSLGIFLTLSPSLWDARDTATTLAVAGGIVVLGFAYRGLPLRDPIFRGWLALFFKSLPQVVLAVKVGMDGGAGLAPLAVWAGHVTICIRIGQLAFSIREAGWDRNRRGSFLSEVGNELSWVLVTVVWLGR